MSKSGLKQSSCPCLPVTCNDHERPTPPVQYSQHELGECFPCFYRPLQYLVIERFPCVQWMKKYNWRWLLADIVAGLTVGLMVVPQALAYAEIADVPHRVSGFVCSLVSLFSLTLYTRSTSQVRGLSGTQGQPQRISELM